MIKNYSIDAFDKTSISFLAWVNIFLVVIFPSSRILLTLTINDLFTLLYPFSHLFKVLIGKSFTGNEMK